MTLTRPIPVDTRNQLSSFPEYARCAISNRDCAGAMQWHHHFTYQGKRTDDPFGIIAICTHHQDHMSSDIRRKLDAVMMAHVDDTIQANYPRKVSTYSN